MIEALEERLGADNTPGLVVRHDLVVDCTDNFPTRYLLNDACVRAEKPDVFGSVHRFEGQVAVWATKDGPCYRCPHPTPLQELPARLAELERDAEIVVYCKMGGRSARAVELLRSRGYARARGLDGGMLSWIRAVEPGLPAY